MTNQLKMAKVNAILTLVDRGWSQRRIARELGVDRETVGRYVQKARSQEAWDEVSGLGDASKPANAPIGSEVDSGGIEATPDSGPRPAEGEFVALGPPATGGRPGPASQCEPFRSIIEAKLSQGLTAQRIWQDLVDDHGLTSRYHSVRRFVKRLRQDRPLPFRRMEVEPGQEAQVDFGSGAPVVTADGKRRRTHVLRVVLSHSRKGYSQAVFRETTEALIECLEEAFRRLGGVPKTVVLDNLRAAVRHPDWYDPELVPRLESFCRHYGTVILPTKPYMPRHKGKVERGVDYVKANALKARQFPSLEDENRHLLDWETRVADTRLHGTTRKQVLRVFTEVERPALLPLPIDRFPLFHEGRRSVHRDGHVEVAKAYYSAPPEYVGREVWVRWDSRLVRIFTLRMEPIGVHVRHDPGRFSTHSGHIHPRKISGVERGAEWLLSRARLVGSQTDRWAQAMLARRGIQGVRVLVGLLSLAKRDGDQAVETACAIAVTHGAFRLRTIRELIKRADAKQEQFDFIQNHEIIRDLGEYGQFVRDAIGQDPMGGAPVEVIS
jgi:transposase